ncbi:uncharacterized protein LOC122074670 isoform X1 [Macadamia integrifolia]|uniref:uncharacterized protein LOC122074670 isoform X1 n=1 Tax=Macadamia integrifolia TaxID=60698 RepID=UPI001C4FB925|nr:uncharacterized protein LOC122074670 isoform X1 [Macadamia integrifolia]XP_042495529.1 uncharacterized protein LOC122074670 isoform X1 [Macadamia integrifolia]XP_042495530.1 uncharacterized protein LOC122074670 isoform X1 [Macadamia integrifolia]XP_042495532.1 uncharacterized protein LOC122074670 isoform X1 [Macadamia integrifolia]XP_042495533.1 uncharacterized protein LOC122074670 isoform X1 [Macadamia integrifolia]XP_042495534.1 uncharacterized protein LOC122074670 isoform X1 [Macadamia i
MVVNVCVQMGTGVIFAFTIEHIIIIICILVLLLLLWSSALGFRGQIECSRPYIGCLMSHAIDDAKGQQGLRKLLVNLHIINYSGNPQIWTSETSHHHNFVLLCTLSSVVVLQAMVRSFAFKKVSLSCSCVSDYKWSILVVIVAQLLTIVVGTICIIRRWFSLVRHSKMKEQVWAHKNDYHPERELEYLKLMKTLSFRFPNKKLHNVLFVARDFIIDVLIHTQIVLYTCSSIIGIPIFTVMKVFFHIFHQCIEGIEEMPCLVTNIGGNQALSSLWNASPYNNWIMKMAIKDVIRWTNTYKRDHPTLSHPTND